MQCAACGEPRVWAAEHGQWWCHRCGNYAPPLNAVQQALEDNKPRARTETTTTIALILLGIGLIAGALFWLDHPNVGGESDAGAIAALQSVAGLGGVMLVVGLYRLITRRLG